MPSISKSKSKSISKSKRSSRKYDEFDTPEEELAALEAYRANILTKAGALATSIDALTENGHNSTGHQALVSKVDKLNTTLDALKTIIDNSDDGKQFHPFRILETICMFVRVIKHQFNMT